MWVQITASEVETPQLLVQHSKLLHSEEKFSGELMRGRWGERERERHDLSSNSFWAVEQLLIYFKT